MSENSMAVWGAVIVAAGRGARFGDQDKLLAQIDDRPVLAWSVGSMAASRRLREIVVVVNASDLAGYRQMLETYCSSAPMKFAEGGSTRSGSVRNGLQKLSPEITHVAVQDAARPLVPTALVSKVLDRAEATGGAVPVVAPTSTLAIRDSSGEYLRKSLDRSEICEVQTPQAAQLATLRLALERFPDETDESTALLRAGECVALVQGSPLNIKITYPEDLIVARALAASQRVRD